MLRRSFLDIPACPTLFTPLQMHLREILQLGLYGWVGWLRDSIFSLQHLVENYQVTMVVATAHVTYLQTFTFEDADTIEIHTTAAIAKNGSLITSQSSYIGAGQEVAQIDITLRPVLLSNDMSSRAIPRRLPQAVMAKFESAEMKSKICQRHIPQLVKQIETQGSGKFLGAGTYAFTLHRYAMDCADQWVFMEVAAYVNASRESLVLAKMADNWELRHGISGAIAQFDVELHRPYFRFDRGIVHTKAYVLGKRLVFIHRLQGISTGIEELHATAIEQILIDS